MGSLIRNSDGFGDTNPAYRISPSMATMSDTYGKMGAEVTLHDGLPMFGAGGWLERARLFGMSAGHIIVFSVLGAAFTGFILGAFFQMRNHDAFIWEEKPYAMVGLAEMTQDGHKIYTPVYEERKK